MGVRELLSGAGDGASLGRSFGPPTGSMRSIEKPGSMGGADYKGEYD